jgi:hypothetical protein
MIEGVLLSKLGRECLVVERRQGPQTAPAAHVVNARTFEICRQAGLDMRAIDAACKDPADDAACKDPADAGHVRFVTRLAGEEIGHLPFERQGDECLRYTPTPLRNLSQHRFEPILAETLRKLPRSGSCRASTSATAVSGSRAIRTRAASPRSCATWRVARPARCAAAG